MAANLSAAMDAGQSLVIFDVNAAAAVEVADSLPNATVAGSVAEVAAQSETVITMVPETSHVEAVYLGGARRAARLAACAYLPRRPCLWYCG